MRRLKLRVLLHPAWIFWTRTWTIGLGAEDTGRRQAAPGPLFRAGTPPTLPVHLNVERLRWATTFKALSKHKRSLLDKGERHSGNPSLVARLGRDCPGTLETQ
jgi:hypothetical protein